MPSIGKDDLACQGADRLSHGRAGRAKTIGLRELPIVHRRLRFLVEVRRLRRRRVEEWIQQFTAAWMVIRRHRGPTDHDTGQRGAEPEPEECGRRAAGTHEKADDGGRMEAATLPQISRSVLR